MTEGCTDTSCILHIVYIKKKTFMNLSIFYLFIYLFIHFLSGCLLIFVLFMSLFIYTDKQKDSSRECGYTTCSGTNQAFLDVCPNLVIIGRQ